MMTGPLPWVDVLGAWIGIFLTLCILSYLYKDNPFYKLAEHLFVGVSIGYVITQQYYNTIKPNLLAHLADQEWIYLIPLVLVVLLFTKSLVPRLGWVGRYPIAFVVALYAGIQINAVAQADLAEQVKVTMQPVDAKKVDLNTAAADEMAGLPGITAEAAQKIVAAREEGARFESLDQVAALPTLTAEERERIASQRGALAGLDAVAAVTPAERSWFEIFNRLLLVVGLIAALVYFYFSIEPRGPVTWVSRFGVWILMGGFGASFGYTVQGRPALAIGRAMDVLDIGEPEAVREQLKGEWVALLCMILIAAGIVAWERFWAPRGPDTGADEEDEVVP